MKLDRLFPVFPVILILIFLVWAIYKVQHPVIIILAGMVVVGGIKQVSK